MTAADITSKLDDIYELELSKQEEAIPFEMIATKNPQQSFYHKQKKLDLMDTNE